MYKPAVTQILFVSRLTANRSNSWLFCVLHSLLFTAFLPTLSVCVWPSQSQHLLTALVFFCQLELCLFSVCAYTLCLSFFLSLPSFLFLPFALSPFLHLFISFLLSLIILVSRYLKFYNTEWQGWIVWHLVSHSLQTTEILKLPTHTQHILQNTWQKLHCPLFCLLFLFYLICPQINSILLTVSLVLTT